MNTKMSQKHNKNVANNIQPSDTSIPYTIEKSNDSYKWVGCLSVYLQVKVKVISTKTYLTFNSKLSRVPPQNTPPLKLEK